MRSGKGRHRRPRQAPAVFVTAGVAGAGLALPLLGTTTAQAAGESTWDRVAECESDGLWSANEENGYYGGLQITLTTWKEYGGTAFAERPDLASRGEQIAVAERILQDQGADAWPGCASGTGLADDDAEPPQAGDGSEGEDSDGGTGTGSPERPDQDPPAPSDPATPPDGTEDTASPDAPDEPETPDGTEAPDGTETPGESASPDAPEEPEAPENPGDTSESGGSGESGGSSDEPGRDSQGDGADGGERGEADSGGDGTTEHVPGPGTGKHRGQPDERERGGADGDRGDRDERDEQDGGAHDGGADRGDGGGHGGGKHRVAPGDSLSAIAAEEDVSGGWQQLYRDNRTVVGDDPDLIHPGQDLRL